MKKSLLIFFVFSFLSAQAQITLDKNYPNGLARRTKMANAGEKYYLYDASDSKAKIYNANHTLWRSFTLPIPAGGLFSNLSSVSQRVINNNNKLEAIYTYVQLTSTVAQHVSKVVDQDGNVLLDLPDALTAYIDESGGLPPVLIVNYGIDDSSAVYSVPGLVLQKKYPRGMVRRLKLENSGEKYYLFDKSDEKLKLYNANHTAWKTLDMPVSPDTAIANIQFISRNSH